MVAIVKPGINFSDPREFHRSAVLASKLSSIGVAGTQQLSTGATFFTQMAINGLADDTNWTADTYKTLLSISSGMGIVASLVGPTGLAGTPTTTFEITVDGVLYTIAVAQTTTGHRSVLGPLIVGTAFTAADTGFSGPDSIDAGKTVQTLTSYVADLPSIMSARMLGTPCLMFRQSLLIRAKSSESNSTTTNKERQAAIQYMVMA